MHVRFVGEADDGISVSSHHARALARVGVEVSFDGDESPSEKQNAREDVVHVVSFEQQDNALLRRLVAARMAGAVIVRYWTGRDVIWATHHQSTLDFARTLSQLGAVQICRTAKIADALAACGVSARPIPIISPNLSSTAQPRPIPRVFTVLCYLPRGRRMYHGSEIVEDLVRRFPTVRFLILGDGREQYEGMRNVEPIGLVDDCTRAIQRATVFVDARLDGALSRLALETMCHGRHVVSGYPHPLGRLARTTSEFAETLRSLRRDATFNLAGRERVCRENDQNEAVRTLRRILEDAVEPGRLNLAVGGGVRGAAAMLRNLHLLRHREFPLPRIEALPSEAHALRALLSGEMRADTAVPA